MRTTSRPTVIPARTMCPLGYEAEVTTGRATNRCQTGKSRRPAVSSAMTPTPMDLVWHGAPRSLNSRGAATDPYATTRDLV